MRSLSAGFLYALFGVIAVAGAPRVINYDLRGRSDSLGEIRVGSGVELRIIRMNPVRYVYGAKTGTTAIDPVTFTEFFAFLPVQLSTAVPFNTDEPSDRDLAEAADAGKTADDLSIDIARTEQDLSNTTQRIGTARAALGVLRDASTIGLSSDARTKLNQEVAALEEQVRSLEGELEALRKQLADLKAQLQRAQEALAAAQARLDQAAEVNKRFQAAAVRIGVLTNAVETYAKQGGDAVKDLQAAEKALLQLYMDSDAFDADGLVLAAQGWVRVLNPISDWPTASPAKMVAGIDSLRGELAALKFPDEQAFGLWSALGQNADTYLAARKRLDDLTTALDVTAKNKAKYLLLRAQLEREGVRLGALSKEATVEVYDIRCGDQPNKTDWKLTVQDRVPKDAGGEDDYEVPIATFVCANWATISSGVLFSGLAERKYAFKPSLVDDGQDVTTENVVGLDAESDFQPLLGLMANFRFTQIHPAWALYGSVGATIDLAGEDAGDVGFLAGPTLGFRDMVYVTIGPIIGRVPSLAPGFELGAAQPMGVTDVPVTKRWDLSWVLGLTFKIR